MELWECIRCGKCCTNQYNNMDIFAEEVYLFPKNKIKPKLGYGDSKDSITIFLYNLISKRCPLYKDDIGCSVYENRPLICKMFPLGQGGLDKGCVNAPKDGEAKGVFPKDTEIIDIWNQHAIELWKKPSKSKVWLYKNFKWRPFKM